VPTPIGRVAANGLVTASQLFRLVRVLCVAKISHVTHHMRCRAAAGSSRDNKTQHDTTHYTLLPYTTTTIYCYCHPTLPLPRVQCKVQHRPCARHIAQQRCGSTSSTQRAPHFNREEMRRPYLRHHYIAAPLTTSFAFTTHAATQPHTTVLGNACVARGKYGVGSSDAPPPPSLAFRDYIFIILL